MSFTIQMGTVSEERNKLYKSFHAEYSGSGTLREETSIIKPVVNIQSSVDTVASYNYAYIPEFNRYYFINDITSVTSGITQISMEVDVLMTYYSGICNMKGIIDRSSIPDYIDKYMDDSLMPSRVIPWVDCYNFEKTMETDQSVILVVSSAGS